MTSSLETEWDYSGEQGKDGQKRKQSKPMRKGKSKKEQRMRKSYDKHTQVEETQKHSEKPNSTGPRSLVRTAHISTQNSTEQFC